MLIDILNNGTCFSMFKVTKRYVGNFQASNEATIFFMKKNSLTFSMCSTRAKASIYSLVVQKP